MVSADMTTSHFFGFEVTVPTHRLSTPIHLDGFDTVSLELEDAGASTPVLGYYIDQEWASNEPVDPTCYRTQPLVVDASFCGGDPCFLGIQSHGRSWVFRSGRSCFCRPTGQ